MEQIMSLFTSIGDILNSASWFQLIKWPFWVFVIILAGCGIHTAHHGKGNLLSQAFRGVLKVALIYMVAVAGYIWVPGFMAKFSELPFLTYSENAVSLVNPLGLLDRWDTALPEVLVRLYFLLFFINVVSVFEYTTPNFLGWLFFQGLFSLLAVLVYAAISSFVLKYWPFGKESLYALLGILLALIFGVILTFKIYFALIKPQDNHKFQRFYEILTQETFGSLFTVTALSLVIVLCYLVVANLFGQAHLEFGAFNSIAFVLNSVMCILTLFVFCRYYSAK